MLKEFTVFVIDLSSEMGNCGLGRQITDLEFGLKSFYDHCGNLLLKNRKLDRIAVILYQSQLTTNDCLEVIFKDAQFTYSDFKEISNKLVVNSRPVEGKNDFYNAVLLGLDVFKTKLHLKYVRNLYVITNANSAIDSFTGGSSEGSPEHTELVNNHGINVVFNGIDFVNEEHHTSFKSINLYVWKKILGKWNNAQLYDTTDVNHHIEHTSVLKKVAPRAAFTGKLRFGLDVENQHDFLALQTDLATICIDVQLYPATKIEKLLGSHEYVIDPSTETITGIKRQTKYFIKKYKQLEDDEDAQEIAYNSSGDEDPEKIDVTAEEYVPGFKFSKRDIIAINPQLKEISQLKTPAGLDILGFIKSNDLPLAYLTNESSYILPPASSSTANLQSFNSFAKALIDLDGVALVRFAATENSEVNVCALYPQLYQIKEKYAYGFSLIRIALKEDEKIGRFPYLTENNKSKETEKSDAIKLEDNEIEIDKEEEEEEEEDENAKRFPSSSTNSLMESFINSKDLDLEENEDSPKVKYVVKNQKLTLLETDFINVPKELPNDTDSKLLPSSPAFQKYNSYLKKIITKSLQKKSLFSFLNEDKFVETYLVGKDKEKSSTNLFNFSNTLIGNTDVAGDWLSTINEKSVGHAKQLINDIKIKYIKTSGESRKRRKYDPSGPDAFFNQDALNKPEGFDPFFDIQDILGI